MKKGFESLFLRAVFKVLNQSKTSIFVLFSKIFNRSPPGYYGKVPFGYELEDHSTMGSFSSATSLNSHVSIPSSTNCSNTGQKTCNGAKNKFKSKKKANGEVNYRQKYKTEVKILFRRVLINIQKRLVNIGQRKDIVNLEINARLLMEMLK